MSTRATISTELALALVIPGAAPLAVVAGISYDPEDPYAVRVGFRTGADDVVEWTFARQLLMDGVSSPVGEGDVKVWPSQSTGASVVCLSLSSPSGRALFEIPLTELVSFLRSTYTLVPVGSESRFVDVEAELAVLLWADDAS